jgi:SPW repeat-containing protein
MKLVPIPRIDRRILAASAVILWVALSPWIWGFVALVLGFGPLALMIVNLRAAAYVTLLGGVWLAVSPWLLGYATDHAAWLNEFVTGGLLIVLCADALGAKELLRARRDRAAAASAGSSRGVAETAGSRS